MGVLFPEVSFTGSSEPPDTGWVLHSPALISRTRVYSPLDHSLRLPPLSVSLSCLNMVVVGPSVTIFLFLLFKTEPNSVVKSTG